MFALHATPLECVYSVLSSLSSSNKKYEPFAIVYVVKQLYALDASHINVKRPISIETDLINATALKY